MHETDAAPDPDQQDLRSFLKFVEGKGPGIWQRVAKTISPTYETTAVVTGLASKLRSPVIFFESVAGCDYPMVTNVCSSIDRVAKSVGIGVDELNARFMTALDDSVPARVSTTEHAPVQHHVRKFGDFTLSELPALIYSERQSEPYITSSIVVARDPDSGAHNLSFHRLMMSGDAAAAIYMSPGGDLDSIWRKNALRGKSTPIAAVIGTHPLWCYASLVSGPLEHDDYAVLASVLGAPIDLVASIGDPDLLVPALAEMVLEGEIQATQTLEEGPFGEFLGFDASVGERPAVRFSRMTSRDSPIYQDIIAGQAEHVAMSSISLRARLRRDYLDRNPAVVDFWLPAAMTIFLAIDATQQTDFDCKRLMHDLLEQEAYLKHVYCFDAGTDLRKLASVQAAIASFVQFDRDVTSYPSCRGNGVDPSERDGKTTKLAIDARSKETVKKTTLPAEMLAQFDLNEWIVNK